MRQCATDTVRLLHWHEMLELIVVDGVARGISCLSPSVPSNGPLYVER